MLQLLTVMQYTATLRVSNPHRTAELEPAVISDPQQYPIHGSTHPCRYFSAALEKETLMHTKLMTGLTVTALATLGLAAAHPASAQTTVTGATTFTSTLAGRLSFNLTSIGSTDWINYGNLDSSINQKSVSGNVVGAISTATVYGTGPIATRNQTEMSTVNWSDGTSPHTADAGNGNSWQQDHANNGFTFNVTLASNSTDIVNLYVGGYNSYADLQVYAGPTQIVDNHDFSTAYNTANGGFFSTTFSNASATSQLLTYNFFETGGTGGLYDNVKLGSVTLASTPTPAAAPEPSQFAGMGFTALAAMGLILKARKRRSLGEAS